MYLAIAILVNERLLGTYCAYEWTKEKWIILHKWTVSMHVLIPFFLLGKHVTIRIIRNWILTSQQVEVTHHLLTRLISVIFWYRSWSIKHCCVHSTNRRKDPHSHWTSQPDPRQQSLSAPQRPQHTACSPETRPVLQAWARAASQAPSPTWAGTPLWVGNKHKHAL